MIKFLSITFLVIVSCFFIYKKTATTNTLNITDEEKAKVYEEMLVPQKSDTATWDKIKNNYSLGFAGEYWFSTISVVRGLADTLKLRNSYLSKFDTKYNNLNTALCICPLVVEGKIIAQYPEDTLHERENIMYLTNYIIQIEKIYKSNYKNLKVGDKVLAKVNLYGVFKSKYEKEVAKTFFYGIKEYKVNESYFLTLDKYRYMMIMHGRKNLSDSIYKEEYCPYAFSLTDTGHLLSEDYKNGIFNEKNIINFLKNEK